MHPFVLGDPARGNLNNRADLRDLPTTPWTRDRRLANVAGGGPSPSGPGLVRVSFRLAG